MRDKEFKFDYQKWVKLNGDEQNIRIVSDDITKPVLLFIHGGPGVCDRHWVYEYQRELARKYTMVLWDQRGSGKSYKKNIKDSVPSVDIYISDAAQLVEYLCKELNKEKIIVIGHSWGTIIGTRLIKEHPEHILAYIGQGQFVYGAENERISYEFCLEQAKAHNDTKHLRKLQPPVEGNYPTNEAMMAQRDCLSLYGGAVYKSSEGLVKSLLIPLLKYNGYKIKDIIPYALGALYLTDVMWPQMASCDYRQINKVDMPILLTIGRHDYNTPFELAWDWYEKMDAPYKKWVWFEESAHSPIKEEPKKWLEEVSSFIQVVTDVAIE